MRPMVDCKSRINFGCGQTPTRGWKNYDNSWSVRLARMPIFLSIVSKLGLISKPQQNFISMVKEANIRWADATKCIPEKNGTIDVIYSSHMLEHLERDDALQFLKEARRILKSGGFIRIAVPDMKYCVENYLKDGDIDSFIENTRLTRKRPRTLIEKLKYLIVGDRNHQWMYDGNSLCKLLLAAGFNEPRVMEPGCTIIPESGEINLEERVPESVFVEAVSL